MISNIDIRGGSEGPRHDPYSFTEVSLLTRRNSWVEPIKVKIHLGLAEWIEIAGQHYEYEVEERFVEVASRTSYKG